jgi:hypothetical protein
MIGTLFLCQSLFSQKRFNIEQLDKIVLDKCPYTGGGDCNYEIYNDTIYYTVRNGAFLTLYKKHVKDSISTDYQVINNRKGSIFYTDFVVDINSNSIYYLFNNGVFHLPNKKTSIELDAQNYLFENSLVYYKLNIENNSLILSRCYNGFSNSGEPQKCHVKVVDFDGNIKLNEKFVHDAIALTHLPSYFIDAKFNKVVFTNALRDEIRVFNLNTNSTKIVGDLDLLNEGIDSIPYNTIISEGVNAKQIIANVSGFAKTIDRIEGCLVLNENTICVVMKLKGKGIDSKRIIKIFQKNINDIWEHVSSFRFRNKIFSKKYGLFQFYYPSGVKVIDENTLSFTEINLPNYVDSKLKVISYQRNMDFEIIPKTAVYVYKFKM